eukprot:2403900-Pleurochrysis_carterae.AAC.1
MALNSASSIFDQPILGRNSIVAKRVSSGTYFCAHEALKRGPIPPIPPMTKRSTSSLARSSSNRSSAKECAMPARLAPTVFEPPSAAKALGMPGWCVELKFRYFSRLDANRRAREYGNG